MINMRTAQDQTALLLAVSYTHAACARLLLERGADTALMNKDRETPLYKGNGPQSNIPLDQNNRFPTLIMPVRLCLGLKMFVNPTSYNVEHLFLPTHRFHLQPSYHFIIGLGYCSFCSTQLNMQATVWSVCLHDVSPIMIVFSYLCSLIITFNYTFIVTINNTILKLAAVFIDK